jgi:L-asparaginase
MIVIYAITTGGMIEKAYSEQTGSVANLSNKIERYLQLLRLPDSEVNVVPLLNKDSLEMKQSLPDVRIPIVFTGAMAPLGFEGSDGLQNLTESLFAVRLLSPGIYVVMHNQAFPIDRVRKDKELGIFVTKSQNGLM